MDKNPWVSVIIPTYNRPGLTRDAAASVLNQTFQDFELLVVDDGSQEEIPGLEALQGVRYLKIPHLGMPGAVRNRGAEAARGTYLAFLDSDDLWLPEKLQLQVDFFQSHPEVSLVHTREIWNRSGKILSQSKFRHRREGWIFSDALEKCIVGPSTVMLRRDTFGALGGFREDLEVAEDYELWLRWTSRHPVGFLDQALVEKRAGHGPQLSEKYGQIEIFRLRALGDLVGRGYFPGDKARESQTVLIKKARFYAAGCRKRGRPEEAEAWEAYAGAWEAGVGPNTTPVMDRDPKITS